MIEELTPEEQNQKTYDAAMDSVNLVKDLVQNGKPADMEQAEYDDLIDRNKRHLEIIVAREEMKTFDLQPLWDAIDDQKTIAVTR